MHQAVQNKAPEGNGVVVRLIAGGEHKRDPALAGPEPQLAQHILVFTQLGSIAPAEFLPTFRIMPKPAA